jgi:hypothetical protein
MSRATPLLLLQSLHDMDRDNFTFYLEIRIHKCSTVEDLMCKITRSYSSTKRYSSPLICYAVIQDTVPNFSEEYSASTLWSSSP